jgi:hypothetical protein
MGAHERQAARAAPPADVVGWTRRFAAIGARLTEAVELYRSLGYEIRLEPAEASDTELADEACAQCMVMTLARTIYTRLPTARDDGEPARRER